MPTTNAAGERLIENFEGCVMYAYDDADSASPPRHVMPGDHIVGTLTGGYGHTGPDVVPGMAITHIQAARWLLSDLRNAERAVARATEVVLSPNQFSALVSFQYNTGAYTPGEPIVACINSRDFSGAMDHLMRYNKANGQTLLGLIRRRQAERVLFETKT